MENHISEKFETRSEVIARFSRKLPLNNIICRYGMINKLLSDQGVNFESNLIKHRCILLGTKTLHTSTYHAPGNGITERVDRNVKPNIAKFVND